MEFASLSLANENPCNKRFFTLIIGRERKSIISIGSLNHRATIPKKSFFFLPANLLSFSSSAHELFTAKGVHGFVRLRAKHKAKKMERDQATNTAPNPCLNGAAVEWNLFTILPFVVFLLCGDRNWMKLNFSVHAWDGWKNKRRTGLWEKRLTSIRNSTVDYLAFGDLVVIDESLAIRAHTAFPLQPSPISNSIFFSFAFPILVILVMPIKLSIFTQFWAWTNKALASGWQNNLERFLLIHVSLAVAIRSPLLFTHFRQMNPHHEWGREKCAVSSWFIYRCCCVVLVIICNLILSICCVMDKFVTNKIR